jgi:hypothetical protein
MANLTMKDTIGNFTNENDYFSGLFQNRLSLKLALSFSFFGTYAGIFCVICIIWFAKSGSDLKRTFLNRLYSSFWWSVLAWFLLIQNLTMIRYSFGPLPKALCYVSQFFNFYITMRLFILLDCIMVARYCLIFWLKNPAGFNDEFWSAFIKCWSSVFVLISQLIIFFLPGQDHPDFWICLGSNPNVGIFPEYKSALINTVIKIVSFAIHIAITARIKVYKNRIKNENESYHPRSKMFWLFFVEDNTVINIAESVVPFVLVGLAVSFNSPRKDINLDILNHYPECLLEYFHSLVRPVLLLVILLSFYIAKKPKLRAAVKQEIFNIIA